jgi:hypothetical protein
MVMRKKSIKNENPQKITAKRIREEQAATGETPCYELPFVPIAYGGRPPKEINIELVKQLCAIHATDAEVAACCGVSLDTIVRRKRDDPTFANMMHDARMTGKASVRRTLYMQAASGQNPAFTMFWAKNHLGMADKPEDTGPIPQDQARRIKEALDAIDNAVTDDNSQGGQ